MTPTPVLAPDSVDALRSIQRFLSFVLAAPWDLAYTRTEQMARPCGTITPIGQERRTGSAYVRDVERDFEIFLYPPGTEGQPEPSRLEAERLATSLATALERGNPAAGSRSMRIPLYDYAAIAWDEGQPNGATPYGFLVLKRNFTVEPRVDPDDSDLFTIVCILTATWRVDGDRSRFEGTTLADVTLPNP